MEKRALDNREAIHFLVKTFYGKVREDELIGPIFNQRITHWEAHLEHLTDFWETNLLFVRNYKGNPIQVHIDVDKANQGSITQVHFGIWLQLWFETINEHFVGKHAETAKNRARNMSTHFFLKMYASREN